MEFSELAGILARFCLCKLLIGSQRPFRRLCLCPAKSRFPTAKSGVGGDSVRMLGSVRRKAEHLVLLRPFGGQVDETGNAHPVREPAIDGGFDEIGCEEGE